MSIETSLGTIITEVDHDPNHPGIYLCLKTGQNVYAFCLLQVVDNQSDNPALSVVTWNASAFTQKSSKDDVDLMFEEVK